MIKQITILFLDIYQKFISPLLHQLLGIRQGCRFEVSCSEYAKNQVMEKGVLKGVFLAGVRILKCQPFYKTAI